MIQTTWRWMTGPVRGVRRTTVAGGVVLGGLLAAVLAVLGVLGVGARPDGGPAAPPTAGPGPRTATQPELRRILLTGQDLPGYAAARPAATAGPTARPPRRPDRCRELFEAPWDVNGAGGPRRLDRVAAEHTEGPGGTMLRQVLTVFESDGAARAIDGLRGRAKGCPEFGAALDDGGPVTVRSREVALDRAGDETYALEITARGGPGGTVTGYVAVARVGGALTVLRLLGPAGTVRAGDASATLHRAVGKMRAAALLAGLDGTPAT